jgi:hypothetical protein
VEHIQRVSIQRGDFPFELKLPRLAAGDDINDCEESGVTVIRSTVNGV